MWIFFPKKPGDDFAKRRQGNVEKNKKVLKFALLLHQRQLRRKLLKRKLIVLSLNN